MSALSEQIHWWSCAPDANEIEYCAVEEAIREELENGCNISETADGSWPDPDATIEVIGYVIDTDADGYDPEAEDDIPLKRAVKGWVRASIWAKRFDLAYGPLYEVIPDPGPQTSTQLTLSCPWCGVVQEDPWEECGEWTNGTVIECDRCRREIRLVTVNHILEVCYERGKS